MAGLLDNLLDVAQGASNGVAGNLSAPVDGINWLLRKAGVPVSDMPVGGSDWLRQKGLTAEPKSHGYGLLGEALGGVAPIFAAAKAPQIARGLLQAGENLATPNAMLNASQRGAIVWHGSPHKFDAFDASKIGTGEGAQAYGHGLYLADSPDVAKGYVDALSKYKTEINGQPLIPQHPDFQSGMSIAANGYEKALNQAQLALDSGFVNKQSAQTQIDSIKKLKDAKITQVKDGALYKVELPDEHIAKMLDYDLPINQQSPHVLESLKNSGILEKMRKNGGYFERDYNDLMKGEAILSTTSRSPRPVGAKEESEALRQAGITGIKYLDQVSRGAGTGSSNYVVFPGNEGLLNILERNGQKP